MTTIINFDKIKNISCGTGCLYIVSKYYSKDFTIDYIKNLCNITPIGISLSDLCRTAELLGFSATATYISFKDLKKITMPSIVLLYKNHYSVLYKITKNFVYLNDPLKNNCCYKYKDFLSIWHFRNEITGIAIIINLQ